MRYIADVEMSKKIDDIAINRIGIPSVVLMERAAEALAKVICEDYMFPSEEVLYNSLKVASICGKGNNGGDAIAAARILNSRGFDADIFLLTQKEELSEEARLQCDIAEKCGLNIYVLSLNSEVDIDKYDIIIDGIFGVGISRPVQGIFRDVITGINLADAVIYSVDVPSGIDSSDGSVKGVAVKADVTVTFGISKVGLVLYPGSEYAGRVVVDDYVFPKEVYSICTPAVYTYDKEDMVRMPRRVSVSNKGTYGHVLVISGTKGMSGAAYLTSMAAYRTGCGLVKIITHEDNRIILQSQLPEAIISTYDDDSDIEAIIEKNMPWADSVVVGPGIGINDRSRKIVELVLRTTDIPLVIDADAINIIAESGIYNDSFGKSDNIILTPHLKEMSRLLGNQYTTEYIREHIMDIVSEYSYNDVVLVLKEARTVVKYRDSAYINSTGNNGMATAGSGDVLAGIIASLAAQGMNRQAAAEMGVYIHGLAGDHAAAIHGEYSMIAGDIIDCIECVLGKK